MADRPAGTMARPPKSRPSSSGRSDLRELRTWGHCIVEDKIGDLGWRGKAAYPDKLARFGSQIIVVEGTDKASKEATVLEAAKNEEDQL